MNNKAQISSLDLFATEKLEQLESESLRRRLVVTNRSSRARTRRGDQDLISFCCNDYLGLSHHPAVVQAAAEALERYGAGAGASRLVTGNHELYEELEERLARSKGTAAACVFGSGYLANLGIPPVFMGRDDLMVADSLCHSSMHAGMRASGSVIRHFAHNDLEECESILEREREDHPRCMILTEGVFSMDGDRAPLAALCDLAGKFDAWLMVDDAHGFGVLGGGRGSAVEAGVADRVALQMGTLSKAIGSYGGFLCASEDVIALMPNRARSLIYATGLPPASIAAAIAALDLIENDPALVAAPLARARQFTQALGLDEAESAIVPIIIGDPARALAASASLEAEGFLVTAIRPPTVPSGTARLRFTFCADHTDADIERLISVVRTLGLTEQ